MTNLYHQFLDDNHPKNLITVTATILSLLVFSGTAHAVLDQQQTSYEGGQQIRDEDSYAQTFTAGISGLLHQIEIVGGSFASSTIPLHVEIRTAELDGTPSSTVIASTTLLPDDLPYRDYQFVTVPFSAPATVTAGEVYAIVLYSEASHNVYNWLRTTNGTTDLYALGHAWIASTTPPTSWGYAIYDTDFAFKTYVRDREADLAIAMSHDPHRMGVINLGGTQELTYTIRVSNNGPDAATDVAVSDTIPRDLSLSSVTSSQGSCSESLGTITCELGTLEHGAHATITIVGAPFEEGLLTNTASATTSTLDVNQENNTATNETLIMRICAQLFNRLVCL